MKNETKKEKEVEMINAELAEIISEEINEAFKDYLPKDDQKKEEKTEKTDK